MYYSWGAQKLFFSIESNWIIQHFPQHRLNVSRFLSCNSVRIGYYFIIFEILMAIHYLVSLLTLFYKQEHKRVCRLMYSGLTVVDVSCNFYLGNLCNFFFFFFFTTLDYNLIILFLCVCVSLFLAKWYSLEVKITPNFLPKIYEMFNCSMKKKLNLIHNFSFFFLDQLSHRYEPDRSKWSNKFTTFFFFFWWIH